MANSDELKILIEGVAVWNKWIEKSFRVSPVSYSFRWQH